MRTSSQRLADISAGGDLLLPARGRSASAERLALLRGEIARLAAGPGEPDRAAAQVVRLGDSDLGGSDLDDRLGGGLKAATLHEAAALEAGDASVAFAFGLGLAFRAAGPRKPVLLIMEEVALAECGTPDGHGLAAHGFDPARLILVRARRATDALWAFEEGLRCPALGAAFCGVSRLPTAYDLTTSRRLVLAARAGGVTGLFAVLAQGGAAGVIGSAAETRWEIATRPSLPAPGGGPGPVALRAHLRRRRGGDPASFDLEWSHDDRSFGQAGTTPLSRAWPAASADRSHSPARARG